MKIEYGAQTLDLTPKDKGYTATAGDQSVSVEVIHHENGHLDFQIDGRRVTAFVSSDGAKRWVTTDGRTVVLTRSSGAKRGGAGSDHSSALTAPMPGQVRSVNVSVGEAVTKGQTLLVLEAMKMEIRVQAPGDGIVKKLLVKQGQTVDREQILIEIVDKLES